MGFRHCSLVVAGMLISSVAAPASASKRRTSWTTGLLRSWTTAGLLERYTVEGGNKASGWKIPPVISQNFGCSGAVAHKTVRRARNPPH
jgi:hypothetical protein